MTQRMVILGAGTALPDRDRDNTSLLWVSPAGSLLLDCGGRAYQQVLRAEVDPLTLRGAVLSHNHTDHIYGVPALLFHLWLARYSGTFDIYANQSTVKMAHALCDALELPKSDHMCTTSWHTLPEEADHCVLETELYTVYTAPVRHSRPTLAIKIVDHESGRTIVFSADTEPCAEIERFAYGANTLIHEATTSDPNQGYGHTTPRQAGEIAARSGAEQLVLIHYSALYTMPEDEALAEVRAGGFTGKVAPARELDWYAA